MGQRRFDFPGIPVRDGRMQPSDPQPPDSPDSAEPRDFIDTLLRSAFGCEKAHAISEPGEVSNSPVPEWIGRFRVLEHLGTGGVGEVYKVVDPSLGRTVALKVLKARAANHDHLVRSFFGEAKLAGSLEHPGVVPLHEFGTLPDGRPFLTMRIISGRTFSEEFDLAEPDEQSRSRFLEILLAVAKTLAFAHARQVVHGDVKPQNIMVGSFGEVQLIDWGFARELDLARSTTDSRLPGGVRVVGTPAYMAPEQARGDHARIDARTDVFGLGAILGEILTGDPPNLGSSRSETVRVATEASHEEIAARLSTCGADQELVELAMSCLAPDPERRPQDASVVVAALSKYLTGVSERVRRAELAAERANAVASHARRSRTVVLALATMLLVLVSAVGLVWLRLERERGQRRAAIDIEATRALEEARNATARASDPGTRLERAPWERAHDAVRRVVSFTTTNETAPELVNAATSLDEFVAREMERNEIASRTLARLEALHHRSVDDKDVSRLEVEFARAYEEHGIDLAGNDFNAIAARIRSDLISDALVMGLDNWAHARRVARRSDWTNLADLVIACETNAWRLAVRGAARSSDSQALVALAAQDDVRNQPAVSRMLLARNLLDAGERATGLSVFASAQVDHPDDYWLCHDYATALGVDDASAREQVIRLFSMANALRPHDVHTLVDLGRALSFARELEPARALLERAATLDPSSGRAWLVLSSVRALLGEKDLGIAASVRAFEMGESAAGLTLADHFSAQGRIARAADILRATVDAYPKDPVVLVSYGRLKVSLFDFETAAAQFDRALATDPAHLEAKICRAYCTMQLGDPTAAIQRLEESRNAAVAAGQSALVQQATAMLGAAKDLVRVEQVLAGAPESRENALYGDALSNSEVFSNLFALLTSGRSLLAAQATEALLRRPGTQSGFGLRFTGARAAARLALDDPSDAVALGDAERGSWWRKAADWLAADLTEIEKKRDAKAITRRELRSLLDSWRAEPALARLDSLSIAGQDDALAAWREVWSRLEGLRSSVDTDD